MDERDVPRRRLYQAPDADYDPYAGEYAESYHESDYADQTGGRGRFRRGYDPRADEARGYVDPRAVDPRYAAPRVYDRMGSMPADRGGSGPHFYDPSAGRGLGLPDLEDEDDFDGEPRANWRRRSAMAALGGGAAALIGGGAYAVIQFFGDGSGTPKPTAAEGDAKPAYVDQNQSLMHGEAGLGVRKNTPTTGKSFGTPADAARNAQVLGKTVLPKDDPVRHLASRLTFGPTPKVIGDIKTMGINAWIDKQLKPSTIPLTRGEQKLDAELANYHASYETLRANRETIDKNGQQPDRENVKYAIGKQIWSDRQLFEMMVDFWNDFLHVAAYHDGNEAVRASFDREVIRAHAMGNYVDMFLAANKHPALLNYLDQNRSTKNDVNENLARENLELYTVGAANGYTEADVRQAAMLQTGRSIRDGKYIYRPEQHYVGPVKIMGFSHPNPTAEGGEAVQEAYFRYIATHPNTARYVAQNLATRFVSDTPPSTLVDAMAKTYLDKKSNVTAVLMTMLTRTEFWASVGQKVRRPGEYLAATYRALGVQPDAPTGFTSNNPVKSPMSQGLDDLHRTLDQFGHAPMVLPTPNGYPDVYVAWTSTGTMVSEWNDAQNVIDGGRRQLTVPKPDQLLGATPPGTAGAYLDALTKRLINVTLTAEQKKPFFKLVSKEGQPAVTAGTPVDATFNGAISAVVRTIFATPHHHLR